MNAIVDVAAALIHDGLEIVGVILHRLDNRPPLVERDG
jgi:hypothetical protein